MKEPTNIKKTIGIHLLIITPMFLILLFLNMSGIGCPIRHVTGIPCPTCGITRATISFTQGNFEESFYYHPLAIPTIVFLLLSFHEKHFSKKWRKVLFVCDILLGILLFIIYIYRLFYHRIP